MISENKKILITVKTYPHPSKTYQELVCTAGVTELGDFIRLYPIDYRYRPYWQWYDKYQWISVDVVKNEKDVRPESYRPISDIIIHGEPLPTKNCWAERKKFVLAQPQPTMCELNALSRKEKSLSIVKPSRVVGVVVEKVERNWKGEWQLELNREWLFGPKKKPLEKIPYKFSYKYYCDSPGCQTHTQMIIDWELGSLFLKMRDKFKDENVAIEKVKNKFYNEICGENKDTYFYVGTTLEHNSWVILGTFYPPLRDQNDQYKNSLLCHC